MSHTQDHRALNLSYCCGAAYRLVLDTLRSINTWTMTQCYYHQDVIEVQAFSLNLPSSTKALRLLFRNYSHFYPVPHFQRLRSNWTN